MLGVTAETLEIALEQLLSVIAAPTSEVRYRARYEAARCLARLHPSAPPCYCDYVTYRAWQAGEGLEFIYGYAARGFLRRERKISDHPPEAILRTDTEIIPPLEREVTKCLFGALRDLAPIPEIATHGDFFRVNCSHALIRWLSPRHADLVTETERLLRLANLDRRVEANLLLALHRCGVTVDENLFETGGDPPGLRVR